MSGGRSGVLAVIAALVLAAPAGAAAPGAVEDLTWGAESGEDAAALDARQQRTVDKTVEAGARWVRLTVNWADAQPRDPKDPTVADPYDQWYLAHYESAVAKARAAGLNVIVVIGTSPVWASGTTNTHPSLQDHYPPLNASDYANFVGFIAGRFRGRVQAYEIWNEQNLQRFWHTPTGLPDPQGYATLLRAAYLKVKAADPNAKVVYGGLAGNDWQFVEASYDAPSGGVKGSFDVMATHPYTYCGQTAPEDYGGGNPIGDGTGARIPKDRFPAYREVRASMLARADEKPIWFTEFGWSSWTTASVPGRASRTPPTGWTAAWTRRRRPTS